MRYIIFGWFEKKKFYVEILSSNLSKVIYMALIVKTISYKSLAVNICNI